MQTSIETSTSAQFIEPNDRFRPDFNRLPFQFFHRLADHPLFKLPRLLELARATRRDRPYDVYYDAGPDIQVGQRWDQMGPKPFVVEEAVHRIETCGAWVTLHQAQKDPEYGALFYECMREFEHLTGVDFRKVMKVEDALIFITSPRRVTPYHIDRECNFLLQIRGEKNLYVFDRNDKEVLPVTEVERFWTVDSNAAVYKPQFQNRATTFRLVPGNGVHIPVNNPHWVQNEDDVSISLSVNFTWKDWERANVHRANFLLRKLMISPQPPKQSALVDAVKHAVITTTFMPTYAMGRGAMRVLRRLKGDRGDGFRQSKKSQVKI
jgi:hypothetical protein